MTTQTTVFVEQPLASPGFANSQSWEKKKNVVDTHVYVSLPRVWQNQAKLFGMIWRVGQMMRRRGQFIRANTGRLNPVPRPWANCGRSSREEGKGTPFKTQKFWTFVILSFLWGTHKYSRIEHGNLLFFFFWMIHLFTTRQLNRK